MSPDATPEERPSKGDSTAGEAGGAAAVPPLPSTEDFFGGAVVFAYTRADALADGVLIDMSETAREAGFRLPVA